MKPHLRTMSLGLSVLLTALLAAACSGGSGESSGARPSGVPTAGASKMIDKILKNGEIRVGVLPEFPWLVVNNGGGDPYKGPSWYLAQKYAEALGVKLKVVQVSNDTKVPLVQSGGVDITIGPLNETPERKKVIDFVTYSHSAICFYGLKTDPKVAAISTVDEMKQANVTVAYFVGQPFADWLPENFPKAKVRAVQGSGSDAPVEELLSGRADYVPADAIKLTKLQKAYPDMITIPRDCLSSDLQSVDTGQGIAKGDAVFADFLRGIEKANDAKIRSIEKEIIQAGPQQGE